MVFSYCIGIENQIWIGATPEVLLTANNGIFLTNALAGTKTIHSDTAFGTKEKEEQEHVKNYIIDLLKDNHAEAIEISEVKELNTGNLMHLINEITFKTSDPLKVIKNLHPTPAVCGTPFKQASNFINENETFDREFYSGYLGPVYKNAEFSFWVNLRCAKIANGVIRFYAGAGITKDSVAKDEWQETERKMETLRKLL